MSEKQPVYCKYTNDLLGEVDLVDREDINQIIDRAVVAGSELEEMSSGERSDILHHIHLLVKENKEALVTLICREAGKPISYARAEVERCLSTLKYAAEEAIRFGGEKVPMDFGIGEGKVALTDRFPIGVVSCISPFNFPLNLALHKIAPAIAAGCSVILKPSPYAPLSVFFLQKLIEQTDLPKDSVKILLAKNEDAELLITDNRIAMLSFTGSPQIGWKLKSLAAKKKVTLELGGNAAVIIDKTADLEDAAKKIAVGAYLYSGQICISTQRIYCHEDVYEEFSKLLVKNIQNLKCGDPRDEDVLVGPLIDKVHLDRIEAWVERAKDKGAKVLVGGTVIDRDHNLYSATLLTDVKKDCEVSKDEVFGPVAILEKISSFEDGIKEVNNSEFGLQAGIFLENITLMKKSFQKLKVGGLMVNNVPGFRIDNMPYGGVKESGLGREGVKYAMEDMTEPRLLVF